MTCDVLTGEDRAFDFCPLAYRLQQTGVKVFSLVCHPLSGVMAWRGMDGEIPWSAKDAKLQSGEVFENLVLATPEARFL